MSIIADLFGRLRVDDTGFEAETVKSMEKAGDAGSKAMGSRISSNLKTGLAVGLGAAAGTAALALGVATKGALELTNATAEFQAATGASGEEAERVGKTINRVAGETRQSLESVTEVAIRVKRDMGSTGDEADRLTLAFSNFARVTRQDAGESVSAFDDILDSWGLTAEDAVTIMDKLLVSQHKFGGSITETQTTLAKLAPAMRAANFEIDDGIALLGLFGSKGLDSERAAAAFSKALTKVKSPEELQALIKDIAATVDPFERARKAADLFGAKAGAQLGNALAGANLDDYKISVEEAAGATQKAADVLDSTVSGRIAKAFSILNAQLRSFGQDLGPALTGVAAVGVIFSQLGLGRLAGNLTKGGLRLGAELGTSIVNGMKGPLTSIGTAISEKLAASTAFQSGATKLGSIVGSTFGKAFIVAALAIIAVELWNQLGELNKRIASQGKDIGKSVAEEIASGTTEGLEQSKAALEKGLHDLDNTIVFGDEQKAARKQVADSLAAVNAELLRRQQDADEKAVMEARAAGGAIAGAYGQGINDNANAVVDGIEGVRGKMADELAKGEKEAARYGGLTASAYAKGILDKQDAADAAWQAFLDVQDKQLTWAQEQALVIGRLTSKQLAAGLHDGRDAVRRAAEEEQQTLLLRLEQLVTGGKPIGSKAMQALADGLKSKNPAIRAEAERIKKLIENNTKPSPHAADTAARNLGANAARALKQGWGTPTLRANVVLANSGYKGGARAEGGPVLAGHPYIVGEKRPELFVPETNGRIIPNLDSLKQGNTVNQETNISVNLPTTARPDPFEVATQLRRLADLKVLAPRGSLT